MLISILYKTNINFIYDTEDTVTNEGNKLNYYCNQLSFIHLFFILIIFIHLILHMAWENHVYYFGLWDRAAHTNI